ncbi:exonuclease subunit SbcD [Labilibacter sediminis]|nr:exonuclease subunit SbcD [Labilibacter sediminis]
MRILHTADWHIGKKLEHYSRIQEQKEVLNEICEITEQQEVDAVLIAGDLFDNFNPSTEAIDLFYHTLKRLSNNGKRPVIAISGNHDSPDRIETADPLARACGITFLGYPNSIASNYELETGLKITKSEAGFMEFKIPGKQIPLRIITTPYANEHRLKQQLNSLEKEEDLRVILEQNWKTLAQKHCDKNGINILATHLFVIKKGSTAPEEPDDEKPILHVGGAQAIYTENFPEEIQYVALGHLHRKQVINSNKNIVAYSGSPLSYSFAEANQKKFVMLVDLEPDATPIVNEIELCKGKKLIKLKALGIDDAIVKLTENNHHLIELTLETETYITAEERRRLNKIHTGIITLIPQVKKGHLNDDSTHKNIDINKGMKELFMDYFKHANGQEPNESILNLLSEVIAEKEGEE